MAAVAAGRSDSIPPYELRTVRLVIRCWNPSDAPLYKDAVDSSLDHLRTWIEWASKEPTPLEAKVALLRRFRGLFDLDQDYQYGIFSLGGEVVGSAGLHARGNEGVFEFGYWIRASRTGQGFATEAVAALTRASFEICGVERLEIHIGVGNEASCRIARNLGYVEEAVLRRRMPPLTEGATPGDKVVFTMLAEEFERSPLASFEVEGRDSMGVRLL